MTAWWIIDYDETHGDDNDVNDDYQLGARRRPRRSKKFRGRAVEQDSC